MTTRTASTFLQQPKAHHIGINTLVGVYAVTANTGDIIKIGRVPDRAVIVAGSCFKQGQGDLLMRTMERTLTSSMTVLTSLLSVSASGVLGTLNPAALNYQVSMSDEVAKREIDIELLVGSASHTGTIKYMLQWTLDHGMK